jgi:hypothetical protein
MEDDVWAAAQESAPRAQAWYDAGAPRHPAYHAASNDGRDRSRNK